MSPSVEHEARSEKMLRFDSPVRTFAATYRRDLRSASAERQD